MTREESGGKSKIKTEFSAGGIVYKNSRRGPVIAFVLDPYKKWAFAKGHIEKREKPIDAAVRETMEEMGLKKLRVIAPLGRISIWFYEKFRKGKKVTGEKILIHKFIYYFLMQAPERAWAKPQKEEMIKAVKWVSAKDAIKLLSYKNVRPVLLRALKEMDKINLKNTKDKNKNPRITKNTIV